MSNIVKVDKSYIEWIESVSKRFRQSQIKAAVKANNEMIRFYWNLGKDMDLKKKGPSVYAPVLQAFSGCRNYASSCCTIGILGKW